MNMDSITLKNDSKRETKAKSGFQKVTLPVTDMTCAACTVSVESLLKAQDGVKDAGVNFANQSAWVEYNPTRITLPQMRKAIQSVGYDLIIDEENASEKQAEAQQKHYQELKAKTIWAAVLSLPLVVIGMFLMDIPYANRS